MSTFSKAGAVCRFLSGAACFNFYRSSGDRQGLKFGRKICSFRQHVPVQTSATVLHFWCASHKTCRGTETNTHEDLSYLTMYGAKRPLLLPLVSHPTCQRLYRSMHRHHRLKDRKEPVPKNAQDSQSGMNESENIDDLKSLLQNRSLSLTAKLKVLFQQYGVVLVAVHAITAAFWFGLLYYAVSRGFDIVPFMERHGVFDFLERIGLPASEKLKSPGASNALAAYLLYEVAKPIRYPVTIIGTIYTVRFLRKLKYFRRPPKTDATVREIVHTQRKIVQHHVKSTASKYRNRYGLQRLRQNAKKKHNSGHRNGTRKKNH